MLVLLVLLATYPRHFLFVLLDRYLGLVHRSDFPKYCEAFVIFRLRPSPHSKFRPFSLQLLGKTPMFVYDKHWVEFSCGFAFAKKYEELVMPYSLLDEFCFCARLSTASVLSTLTLIVSPDDLTLDKLSE
jgi:hypothetical protein